MAYRITTVSELTGIPRNTLVSWERRYGIPQPTRLPNGYRSYSDNDLARLMQIKRRLAEGLKISEAVQLEGVHLERLGSLSGPQPPEGDRPFDGVAHELRDALLAFRRGDAETILRRLMGLPFGDVVERLFRPLLIEIGALWARGDVSVAQEHFASGMIRDQIVSMLLAVGSGPPDGQHCACVTFPGERHEIPLLALTLHLVLSGWRVTYLGADLPPTALAKFANEQHPALICISLTNTTAAERIAEFIGQLRAKLDGNSPPIILGGAGLPTDSDRIEIVGAELCSEWRAIARRSTQSAQSEAKTLRRGPLREASATTKRQGA